MEIYVTTFEESEGAIRFVRDVVFGDEQGVGRALDWDGEDAACVHVVASDPEGRPIGTGRMQGGGKIGRVAVLKAWRGRGVGAKMLGALAASAAESGLAAVYLHAQVPATSFYEKSGFAKEGVSFMEAGREHVNMTKDLRRGRSVFDVGVLGGRRVGNTGSDGPSPN